MQLTPHSKIPTTPKMKTLTKISPILITFAFLIPFCGSNANAAVIYREVFGVATSGSNYAMSNAGWSVAVGDSATDLSTTVNTTYGAFISVGNNGNPQNVDNVNAGGPAASLQKGFVGVAMSATSNQRKGLVYTTEYSFNTANFQNINFSWYEGNNSIYASMRVVVQIGGNWYVSNTGFSNDPAVPAGSDFATQSVLRSFDFTTGASQWSTLNFTSGSTLSIGSTLTNALPTGTITGFGLYNSDTNLNSSMRFDTFTISATAVPEPGAFSLCFLGVGAFLWVRRFRKTSTSHNI